MTHLWLVSWLASGVQLAPSPGPSGAPASSVRYDGHAIVQVELPSDATPDEVVEQLEQLGLHPLADHRHGRTAFFRVPPSAREALFTSEFAFTVIDAELQATLDAEQLRLAARPSPTADEGQHYYEDFRDLDEVYARLGRLVEDAGDLVAPVDVGRSVEDIPILGVRIGRNRSAPVIVISGGQHAREWLSVTTPMAIADALVGAASQDLHRSAASLSEEQAAYLDGLLDDFTFVVIPVLNPDGYAHSWDGDRLWRKNRRPAGLLDFDPAAVGVDLNRNWAEGWGKNDGGSGEAESENYRGPSPFSEPETAVFRDFLRAQPRLRGVIDLHAAGPIVLYPWGHTEAPAPEHDMLAATANAMARAMAGPHGLKHGAAQPPAWNAAASGILMDWSYAALGVPSFTIELRTEKFQFSLFIPEPSEIGPAADEALAGLVAFTRSTSIDDGDAGEPRGGKSDETPDEGAEAEAEAPGCACASGFPSSPLGGAAWLALGVLLGWQRRHGSRGFGGG